MVDKVEVGRRLALAVAAVDERLDVLVLDRHLLAREELVDARKIELHVAEGLGAERADVVRERVLFVARDVHAVAAREEHHGRRRREHVRVADRTVGLERPLDALVLLQADAHACVAAVAVEVVDVESLVSDRGVEQQSRAHIRVSRCPRLMRSATSTLTLPMRQILHLSQW